MFSEGCLRVNSSARIVIIGGGFAGVTLAQRLERILPADAEIVLLSSENHFVFTPLLAETAGREISPLHVVVPGRQMVRRARWLTAQATAVDRASNLVHYTSRGGERGTLEYRHLAIACGSVGFGSLTAFVALYFDSRGWNNAAYCLSAFGIAFICARLASPNALPRFGGYRVVALCLTVQTLGLLLVWLAPTPLVAILGSALTGLGCPGSIRGWGWKPWRARRRATVIRP